MQIGAVHDDVEKDATCSTMHSVATLTQRFAQLLAVTARRPSPRSGGGVAGAHGARVQTAQAVGGVFLYDFQDDRKFRSRHLATKHSDMAHGAEKLSEVMHEPLTAGTLIACTTARKDEVVHMTRNLRAGASIAKH